MPLVQASPEVRELDVDQFRKDLRTIEAGVEGAPWPHTHDHEDQSVLSGTTFARKVVILNPYQVEFEDGQYSVRAVGANHNILDVKVNNQVSLAVFLSSGLITSSDIEHSSFGGGISVDIGNTTGKAASGVGFPTGTPRRPCDNFTDALAIANDPTRAFDTFFLLAPTNTLSALDFSQKRFVGRSPTATTLTVDASANVVGAEFENMTLDGSFDGLILVEDCIIGAMNMVEGDIKRCGLRDTLTLSGGPRLALVECYDDRAGTGNLPEIDFGGSGTAVTMRGYRGGILFKNKTGSEAVSVDGVLRLVLDATFGGTGQLVARGSGPPIQNNGTFTNILDQLDNSQATWNEALGGNATLDARTALRRLAVSLGHDPNNPATAKKVSETLRTVVAGPVGNRISDLTLTGDPDDEVTTQQS